MQNFAMNATILQIIFLIAYGVFWIIFMKSQKRNGSSNYDTRLWMIDFELVTNKLNSMQWFILRDK